MKKFALISAIGFLAASAFAAQGAPMGASVDPTPEEQKALDALKGKLEGAIVWSTSRGRRAVQILIMIFGL